MGRSSTSCFNIISCGCIKDSDVSSENKGHDKPGWSLRKISARQHVPSSTLVDEKIPSSEYKEITEPITISSESQVNSSVSEKTSDIIWTEETPNPITKNVAVSTVAAKPVCEESDDKCEPVPDESESESESESAVLVIQAAVRRFLAEKQLIKHKNVVKLQAAVRGHLVRSHAVGTLRCVQAIVKMQALVRARREKGAQDAGINSTPTHISIEKLLSNRLARQLLESTPKTKQINIKCDPSKSDSAWNWLERWMSVSTPETLQPHTPDQVQEKAVNNTENEVKIVISANSVGEAMLRYEEKEKVINIEENSNVKPHEEEPILVIPVSENPVSETKPKPIPENLISEIKPIPENAVLETEMEHTAKQVPTDQTDSEGRKTVFGSRKASNPAFIAAQSRFEELTSPKTNTLKSPNSSNQDDEAGSGSCSPADIGFSNQNDVAGSFLPADIGSADLRKADNGSQVVQNGGSECETELSVISTLDSPDKFEIENKKSEEVKVPNDTVDEMNMNSDNNNNDNNRIDIVMPEKQVDEKLDDSDIEQEQEQEQEQVQVLEPESSLHVDKSNEREPVVQLSLSESSPRSHITNLESQGTPSSGISTTSKKTKTDKKVSSQTRKSWSYSKKASPVSSSVDYGLRSSLEQLPKDPKPGKRRNAVGSPKPDHSDHESSVPGYMQATESARAKAVASPRSSPDMHDKDLKKRHSLPGAVNAKQGSPRVQRSMSQTLQSTKGNSNQERKWQR